jgi:hypothetical protein
MQAHPDTIREGWLLKATKKGKWRKCWCALTLTTLSVGKHQVDHPLMFHDEQGKDGMKALVVVTRERDFVLRESDKEDLEAWMTALRSWQYPKPHLIPLKRITPRLDPIGRVLLLGTFCEESALCVLRGGLAKVVLPIILHFVRVADVFAQLSALSLESKLGLTNDQLSDPNVFTVLRCISSMILHREIWQFSTDAVSAGLHYRRLVHSTRKMFHTPTASGIGYSETLDFVRRANRCPLTVTTYQKCAENRDSRLEDECLREVYYLSNLDHPNIIKVYDCLVTPDNVTTVIFEYLPGGTLSHLISVLRPNMETLVYVGKELLHAVAYLHSQRIMHRNITLHSIVASLDGSVKLLNFGHATDFALPGQRLYGHPFGLSAAPEMLRGASHDHKCDIWAVGTCLWLFFEEPTRKLTFKFCFRAGLGLLDGRPAFLEPLLRYNPSDRPEAAEALGLEVFSTPSISLASWKKLLFASFCSAD